jgi:hypothetical protein
MEMHISAGPTVVKHSIIHLSKTTSWMLLQLKIGGENHHAEEWLVRNGRYDKRDDKGNIDSASKGTVNGVVVDDNDSRSPSIILKGGIDKQLTDKVRVRISGSFYHNSSK